MIKTILLDVDGTLTDDRKNITEKTRDALIQAQENGVRLVLASGRTVGGLMRYARELDMFNHHGIFVAYNGAKVMDCQSEEVYFNQALTVEEGKAVLNHMKKFDVWPVIDKGEYMYVNDVFVKEIDTAMGHINILKYESRGNGFLLCEKRDLAEFVDFELNKILVAAEPGYLKEHYEEMSEPFKDTLNGMFTAPHYYEYTAKGVDKAYAIRTSFAKMRLNAEETIAFGDAQNDMTMVKYAGVGVAMGNAVDVLKEVSDYVTLDNNHDGIAEALKHFEVI